MNFCGTRSEIIIVEEKQAMRTAGIGVPKNFVAERVAQNIAAVEQKGLVLSAESGDARQEADVIFVEEIKVAPKIWHKEIDACEMHDHGFAPALFAHEISPTIISDPNAEAVFDNWRNRFGELRVLILGEIYGITIIQRGESTGSRAFHVQAGLEQEIAIKGPKGGLQSPIPHDKNIRRRGAGRIGNIDEICKPRFDGIFAGQMPVLRMIAGVIAAIEFEEAHIVLSEVIENGVLQHLVIRFCAHAEGDAFARDRIALAPGQSGRVSAWKGRWIVPGRLRA